MSVSEFISSIPMFREFPDIRRRYVVDTTDVGDVPENGISRMALEIALHRGVERDGLLQFFDGKFDIGDISRIPGMADAVKIIGRAIAKKETIGIVGDYDVDGATSVSTMVLFLRNAGVPDENIHYYIPQRLTEGYGLNETAVRHLHGLGCSVLMTLDSGTLSNGPLSVAVEELGMDAIVVDHHLPGPGWVRPEGIIVNPKIDDECPVAYQDLCTAGLIFVMLNGIRRELRDIHGFESVPGLIELSGLAALGTVADLVPLTNLNRQIVRNGLRHMLDTTGLAALVNKVSLDERGNRRVVNARTLGFGVGPCINAAGRISDCMKGSNLLTAVSPGDASVMADDLHALNRERQLLQRATEAMAIDMASVMIDETASVIIVRNEEWHPGVIGIVASKIVSTYDRPAIVIGAGGKGSGRSIHGFDLGSAVIRARKAGLIASGGGHAAACGLTVDNTRYEEFLDFMRQESKDIVRTPKKADYVMPLSSLTIAMTRDLEKLAPFGMGNPEPRIILTGCHLTSFRWIGKDKTHLRMELECDGFRHSAVMWSVKGTEVQRFIEDIDFEKSFSVVASVSFNPDYPNKVDIKVSDMVEEIK